MAMFVYQKVPSKKIVLQFRKQCLDEGSELLRLGPGPRKQQVLQKKVPTKGEQRSKPR